MTEADKQDEKICKEASDFTKIFYDAMDRKRDKINYLYCDSGSTLVWNGNPVSGSDNIFRFISSLPETDHHLVSVDVQQINAGLPGSPDLLTVTTAGNVTLGGTMHGFTHTFILMVEDGKYKMEFEQLHLKTVELLAAKASTYGLPAETDETTDAAMLAECQQAYFNTRQQLLTPIIQATLAYMASTYADSSCALTRSSCSFILGLCDDEFRLYRQFFSTGPISGDPPSRLGRKISSPTPSTASAYQQQPDVLHPFEEFIEAICRLLYDMLRPIIIHNPHLETLAELCAILKVEMIDERCSIVPAIVAEECTSFDPRAGFVRVIGELVGDVAERIVYRAALYGQTDIAGYKPATGDLAYPEKLEMMKNIEKEKQKEAEEGAERQEAGSARKDSTAPRPSPAPISAVDLHCLWYPTVRRTVMCLAKLYRCLDIAVFQSIARDLLAMCCESLEAAALQISASPSKKTGHSKKLDGELFLVKHLLILREQTTPYRQAAHRADATLPVLDCSIDFAKMKSSLFDDKSRWFELSSNNAFLELLFSVPIHVSEQSGDTRRIIDNQLRTRCNQLITTSANIVVGPFLAWVDTAEDELLKPDFDLKKHPDLSPSKLSELAKVAVKALSHTWPEVCVV
ncbi:nuclear transport factor 2 domain protein [Oesophagostomum dentatum]|uniref:Nuclear transport factor 2 domain protein n=2 Tax=Oesophagostomum dentatum TaxID=61180 RepID=A0A0B1SV43_OESDE|nr:nuclear transport factor 2 domain protein [Oesophagostomum dentatum]